MPLDGETFRGPDPRPAKRTKDTAVMKRRHKAGGACALNCGKTPASLHHVLPRSQGGDDVEANLVFLCGSGTTGHHGLIENADLPSLVLLGEHVLLERPDTLFYIRQKLGEEAGAEWLRRHLHIQ